MQIKKSVVISKGEFLADAILSFNTRGLCWSPFNKGVVLGSWNNLEIRTV